MYARCPQCAQPAKIVDRFTLGSTDGPLEHVKLSCSSGRHWYTPLAEDVEIMEVAPSAEQTAARRRAEPPELEGAGEIERPGRIGGGQTKDFARGAEATTAAGPRSPAADSRSATAGRARPRRPAAEPPRACAHPPRQPLSHGRPPLTRGGQPRGLAP